MANQRERAACPGQANLLTGAVNFLVDTMAAGTAKSMFILAAYCVVVCGLAVVLHAGLDVTLKMR
jgi:hypothetical protein